MFPLCPEPIQMLNKRLNEKPGKKILLVAHPFRSWQSALKALGRGEYCSEYFSMDLLTFMDLLQSTFN